jgi:hypothetical protein
MADPSEPAGTQTAFSQVVAELPAIRARGRGGQVGGGAAGDFLDLQPFSNFSPPAWSLPSSYGALISRSHKRSDFCLCASLQVLCDDEGPGRF